jgi:hypothetical protein
MTRRSAILLVCGYLTLLALLTWWAWSSPPPLVWAYLIPAHSLALLLAALATRSRYATVTGAHALTPRAEGDR